MRFLVLCLTLSLVSACGSRAPTSEDLDEYPVPEVHQRLAAAPADIKASYNTAEMWGQGQAASDSACVRLNNYFCIKTPYKEFWVGQVGRDSREHAHFEHPVFSTRAFARIMRSYHFKHGLQTPIDIIARYAPSHDCADGGSYCPNKVSRYANSVANALGIEPHEPTRLFRSDGTIDLAIAIPMFRIFSKVEIGGKFVLPEALIREGITLEQEAYIAEHDSLLLGPMAARHIPLKRPGPIANAGQIMSDIANSLGEVVDF